MIAAAAAGLEVVRVPSALDAATLRTFAADLGAAAADDARRVLILEGEAGLFCRGMRLGAGGTDASDPASAMDEFRRCLAAIRFARRPVIALVDGETLAGGVGVAAACDLVIASERSTFALSELLFGLAPAAIFPLLVERMAPQKARLMALAGRAFSAVEAQGLGLVDVVVAAGDLERVVKRHARLFARAEPGAVATLKRFSSEIARHDLEAAIERGGALTLAALASPTVQARIAAFESGDPSWGEP